MMYTISQIMAGFALLFMIISLLQKKRIPLIIYNSIGTIFFSLQFFFLSAYAGAIINIIGLLKNIIYIFKGKNKYISSWATPITFSGIILISSIFTFDGLWSLLPAVAALVNVYATWFDLTKHIKYLLLVMSALWIVYDIVTLAYVGLFADVVLVFINIFSLIYIERNIHKKSTTNIVQMK